ncbi:MAG: HAD family hydrolase [Lachnospiraceae bacterium]|nr:HAD family hydrolase [Lachnospiraceae bacterium]
MYHYILFDLDGTLTDPKLGITTCVQYALRHHGIEEPDLDKLEPFIGPPLIDSFMEFYHMTEAEAQQCVVKYRERFKATGLFENEIYEGIADLLQKLHNLGRKLAIASSKPTVFVTKILEYFEIASYFDVVVGSELDGTRSRKEEVVEEALRQLGEKDGVMLTKENCAMVGDRKFDIQGAKEHGLTAVGVAYGYAPEGELQMAGADYIAKDVEELEKLLC